MKKEQITEIVEEAKEWLREEIKRYRGIRYLHAHNKEILSPEELSARPELNRLLEQGTWLKEIFQYKGGYRPHNIIRDLDSMIVVIDEKAFEKFDSDILIGTASSGRLRETEAYRVLKREEFPDMLGGTVQYTVMPIGRTPKLELLCALGLPLVASDRTNQLNYRRFK